MLCIISFQMDLKIFLKVFPLILVTVGARNLNQIVNLGAGAGSIKETNLENCEFKSIVSSVKEALAEAAPDNCFEQNPTGSLNLFLV